MAPKPRCAICNSKRWHRDAISGSIVCEEGHLLQGYVQESIEAQQGPSQFVSITRRQKKGPRERKKRPDQLHEHFQGQRAHFLYVQCLQYILRAQLRVLIEDHGLDERAEAVGRDLWLMLLASQEDKSSIVPDAPGDYARGDEPPDAYMGAKARGKYKRKGKERQMDGDSSDDERSSSASERDEPRAKTGTSSSSSSSRSPSRSGSLEPSAYATDFDEKALETDNESLSTQRTSRRRKRSRSTASNTIPQKSANRDPRLTLRLEWTLLVCYLTCLVLRQPLTLGEILRLAATRKILYLDAYLMLPRDLMEHMNHDVQEQLKHNSVPSLGTRQNWTYTLKLLVRVYAEDWDVTFPEPNMPLVADKYISRLALPTDCYSTTKRLLAILPPLSLTVASARRWDEPTETYLTTINLTKDEEERLVVGSKQTSSRDRKAVRRMASTLPETFVLACLLVSFKMTWGPLLDNGKLDGWLNDVARRLDVADRKDPGVLVNKPVDSMTAHEIDAYLTLVEQTVVSKEGVAASRTKMLATHFPPPPEFNASYTREREARIDVPEDEDVFVFPPRPETPLDPIPTVQLYPDPLPIQQRQDDVSKPGGGGASLKRDRFAEVIFFAARIGYTTSADLHSTIALIEKRLEETVESAHRGVVERADRQAQKEARTESRDEQRASHEAFWRDEKARRIELDEVWQRNRKERAFVAKSARERRNEEKRGTAVEEGVASAASTSAVNEEERQDSARAEGEEGEESSDDDDDSEMQQQND